MAVFKITVIILACLMSDLRKTNAESVFLGALSDDDRLIHRSVHEKIPFIYRTSDIAFPSYYEEDMNVITAVHITDNNLEDGASAEVDYGGVGHTFANIHLRSALFGGFNFTVEIYGIKLK